MFFTRTLQRRAELYYQLGSMITAGVPLIQALEMTAKSSSLRRSRKAIQAIIEHLKNGLTFHESMVRVHSWIPGFDVAMLSAGEDSGRLDASFKFLADYYATRVTIIRDTLGNLLLTAANLHVFLLIFPLGLLISFVRGIMDNQYSECIPFILEKVIVFGGMYLTIFIIIFLCQGGRGESVRYVVESVARTIPFLGKALTYLALSRLTAAHKALVNSGASIIQSWPMSAAASGSPRLKRTVDEWPAHLEAGATPAELVAETAYFPDMFRNVYHTGEISGKLDESLDRLHTYYHDEGLRTLRLFTRASNGALYAIIAAVIGYNVIKFWMNYYGAAMGGF